MEEGAGEETERKGSQPRPWSDKWEAAQVPQCEPERLHVREPCWVLLEVPAKASCKIASALNARTCQPDGRRPNRIGAGSDQCVDMLGIIYVEVGVACEAPRPLRERQLLVTREHEGPGRRCVGFLPDTVCVLGGAGGKDA